ncbi:MAG: hypothetical protein KIT17_10120 [Rubrivivax sp.]|nr:hypothetical protein [Rubrivivax sp.]
MTPNTTRCRQCEGEMTLADLERIEGEEHGVHLSIKHMPSMTCPKGHRRFVAPTFASALLDALVTGQPLVPLDPAARRGLLRKRYACPACGAVLEGGASGRVEAHRTVEIDGLHAFDVQVDLPTFRCGVCQQESVEPREQMLDDLMKASAHAFRSAELAVA